MKKSNIIPVILLLLSCIAAKAQDYVNDSVAVTKTLFTLFDGVSNVDAKEMKQTCTTDFLLLEDGKVWNMDSVLNKLNAPGPKFTRVNKLNFITVKINGENAWVAYHNTGQFSSADGKKFDVNWLESAVLIKQNKRWVVSMLHSTMLKP